MSSDQTKTTTMRRSWLLPAAFAIGLSVLALNGLNKSPFLSLEMLPGYAEHKLRFYNALKTSAEARNRQDWDTTWKEQIKADREAFCYWSPYFDGCEGWRRDYKSND